MSKETYTDVCGIKLPGDIPVAFEVKHRIGDSQDAIQARLAALQERLRQSPHQLPVQQTETQLPEQSHSPESTPTPTTIYPRGRDSQTTRPIPRLQALVRAANLNS